MSRRFADDLTALERDAAALRDVAESPSGAPAAHRYPDGRTVPRQGDEVYTYIGGFGGSRAVMYGTVGRNRSGEPVVRVTETADLIGGR